MTIEPFKLPVRVECNLFGPPRDGETDNIFIVDDTGVVLLIVAKHPVWCHLEKGRLEIANEIARRIND